MVLDLLVLHICLTQVYLMFSMQGGFDLEEYHVERTGYHP